MLKPTAAFEFLSGLGAKKSNPPPGIPSPASPFAAFEVRPAVETIDADGASTTQTFATFADAEEDVSRFEALDAGHGLEGKQIFWRLYGSQENATFEWIADCLTEAEVFAVMASIAGIVGVPGVRFYAASENAGQPGSR